MFRTKHVTFVLLAALSCLAASTRAQTDLRFEVEDPARPGIFVELDQALVGTVRATVRITGVLPEAATLRLERPDGRAGVDGAGLNLEPSSRFSLEVVTGLNRLVLRDAGGEQLAHGTMLNYTRRYEDANEDGVLDRSEDVNGNGLLDANEDANGNGFLDLDEDFNENGRLDVGEDINGSGVLELGEDLNSNGEIDAIPHNVPSLNRDLIQLLMVEGTTDAEISAFVRSKGLHLSGVGFDVGSVDYTRTVEVEQPVDRVLGDVLVELNGLTLEDLANWNGQPVDPPLRLAMVPIEPVLFEFATEVLPPRLMDGAAAPPSAGNAGDAYQAPTGGFDDDNDLAPGGDDDGDGRADEDPPGDLNRDGFPGVQGVDDDGDGGADYNDPGYLALFRARNLHFDDDEDGRIDEDGPARFGDDDNDGQIDEDPPGDRNNDGFPGVRGADDDGDGATDFDDFQPYFVWASQRGRSISRPLGDDDEDAVLTAGADPTAGGISEDGTLAQGYDYDELDVFWPHFFMDTFAAHAVAEAFTRGVANPKRPGIAVIDDGLGTLARPPIDLPFARLLNLPNLAALAPLRTAGSHGLTTASLAGGEGNRILGTGRHASIRPYRVFGTGSLTFAQALDRARANPAIQVINLSLGAPSFDDNLNGRVDDVRDEDGDGTDDEDDRSSVFGGGRPNPGVAIGLFGNGLDDDGDGRLNEDLWQTEKFRTEVAMLASGIDVGPRRAGLRAAEKIVVLAAGNRPTDSEVSNVGKDVWDVPKRGARDGSGAGELLVAVAATGMQRVGDRLIGPEQRSHFSRRGQRISVSAPGQGMVTFQNNENFRPNTGGTSWSAPYVAGLAGELIFVDMNRPGGRKLSNAQIVQLMEATADDLGSGAIQAVDPNTGRASTGPYLNDDPGNGPDDYFGHGRVNAWKATLSAINKGIAMESHTADSNLFKSLKLIAEADTDWYGFRVITHVKGATAWIDNRQVTTAGPQIPDGQGGRTRSANAYRGVNSTQSIRRGVDDDGDGILDEDPTSGEVGVGNQGGEYVITFSATRSELVDNAGAFTKVLELRIPGAVAANPPYYRLRLELPKMRKGTVPGVVFDDFVFEITPTDFGDAPLSHTTRLSDKGPHHLNTSLEWLGQRVLRIGGPSSEPDAQDSRRVNANLPDASIDPDGVQNVDPRRGPDNDRFDDGVLFFPNTYRPGANGLLQFTACVADADSGRYGRDRDRSLFVNGWIDWNGNGQWQVAEQVAKGVQIDPSGPWTLVGAPPPANVRRLAIVPGGNCAVFEVKFTVPEKLGPKDIWSRFRLDYGENLSRLPANELFDSDPTLAGVTGAARFGEVEDYRILEADHFPLSLGRFTIEGPSGASRVKLQGPTTILVNLLDLADTDGNGLEGLEAEMVQLDLVGSSPLGPIRVRIRPPDKDPFRRSLGYIEEVANDDSGQLNLPPFAASGSAASYFDVYFEVEVAGMLLHNREPKRMETEITFKPPRERYESPDFLTLYNENNQPTQFRVGGASHIPVVELLPMAILFGDLESDDPIVRREAAEMLAERLEDGAQALETLLEMREDSDEGVRGAVETAIERLLATLRVEAENAGVN